LSIHGLLFDTNCCFLSAAQWLLCENGYWRLPGKQESDNLYCTAPGVFDGHGGTVAAEYLSVNLYWVFSEALDDDGYGEERPVSGE
jgi:serine/threonine protein phosphatase PrpC